MGYILKILVWVFIAVFITVGIGTAIITPIGEAITAKTDVSAELEFIKDTTEKFLHEGNGIYDFILQLKDGFVGLVDALATHTSAFVGLIFALIFLYLLYEFIIGLSFYPTAYVVDNLMSSNTRYGFSSAMAANFKKACKYSLCKMLVCIPIDAAIMGIMIGVGYGLFIAIKMFALPLMLILGLLLCTLRTTLFSGWLPRLLHHPEEGMFTAFSRSLTSVKRNFKGMFKGIIITYSIAYCCMTGFTIPTFGVINLVIPSLYYFLLRTIELVGYYKQNSMRFYVDSTNVINTVEYGYRTDNQGSADESMTVEIENDYYTADNSEVNDEE